MENLNLNNILEINPYKDLQGKCEITFKEISLSHDSPLAESPLEFSEIDTINGAKIRTGLAELTFSEIWDQDHSQVIGLNIYIRKALDTKLGSLLTTLPWGLLKKNYTGIGATTLELNSPRNSIIVVPTKALAYNKYLSGINSETGVAKYCYVGSTISDLPNTTPQHIQTYLHNDTISHKKLLVVTDSLKKVIEAIGPDIYQNYFLLLDEIDIYQSDSTFRPALEDAIDYYFNFDPRHRSMVSATMQEFSHPLIQKEPLINLIYTLPTYAQEDRLYPKRTIHMIQTDNTTTSTIQQITSIWENHPTDKILIALNKVTSILEIIHMLPQELQSECAILCSPDSEDHTEGHRSELTNGRLPARITFMTCTYFVGVDITECFHLISVSDVRKIYTMLSPAKLAQIAGRCRHSDGLLSETIIYNTQPLQHTSSPEEQRDELTLRAETIANYNHASAMMASRLSNQLPQDFGAYGDLINKAVLYHFRGEVPISLVRLNKPDAPAYMNIDAIYDRLRLRYALYQRPEQLKAALENEGHELTIESQTHERCEEQDAILDEITATRNETIQDQIDRLIIHLKELHESGNLNEQEIQQLERQAHRDVKSFIQHFKQLSPYLPFDQLVDRPELRGNKKEFRGFWNAVIFWALEDSNIFKQAIHHTFPIGTTLTATQIREKADQLYWQFFNRHYALNQEIAAQQHLGSFVKIQPHNRSNNRDLISYNPKELTGDPLQRLNPTTLEIKTLILFPTATH